MKASQTFEISGYKYRPGSRIKVTVRKVTSAGVLVRTEDGAPGVIRRYELSWDRDISDAEVLSIVSIGQELEAVVLGPDEEQRRVMLSLRRVDYEPWEVLKAEKDQWIKAVVRGEVVSLQSYGAFVELADIKGAEGLLHISGIPGGKEKNIEDLLWVGDYVEAVITEIDVEERHLRLSINSRLARNDSRTRRKSKGRHREGEGAVDDASQTADPVAPPGSTHTLRLHKTGKIKKILLIDDAVEFVKAFGRLLLSFGYPVDIANTGEEGFERSLSGEHDLIFLDVHLPDTSGVNVARRILQQNSKAKIVLVTGLDWLERDLDADGLGLVGILLKPLDSNEVIQILQALEAGREVQTPNIVVKDIEQEDEFLSQILPGRSSSFTLASELGRLLGQLCKSTHADNAIVFKIDVVSRRVSVVASNHQVQTHEDALHDLRYSPVKDVAWDRAAIFENDVYRTAKGKFSNLLRYIYFESCIAVPLHVEDDTARYALFLVDHGPGHFSEEHRLQVEWMVQVIEHAFEKEQVQAVVRQQQRLLLAGQLGLSLVHEINNKLAGIEQYARSLQSEYEKTARDPDHLKGQLANKRIQDGIARILKISADFRVMNRTFLGLMKGEEVDEVDINQTIHLLEQVMIPIAKRKKVGIQTHIDLQVPLITAIPLRVEQVFFNLALNAVQHMELYKVEGTTPTLRISTEYKPEDELWPIKVRFSDDGGGIHRQNFDWIFELGTSTREGGSGLGLFLSKGLVESLGGRISVEDSVMFVGTTFLVELPISLVQEALQ